MKQLYITIVDNKGVTTHFDSLEEFYLHINAVRKKREAEENKTVGKEVTDKWGKQEYVEAAKPGQKAVAPKVHPVLDVESRLVMADAFQDAVLGNADTELPWGEALINASLGLAEAIEAQNLVKKFFFHPSSELFHNEELLKSRLRDELGDTLFYAAWLSKLIGSTLGDDMKFNVRKLGERHKETGGFPKTSEQNDFNGSAIDWW